MKNKIKYLIIILLCCFLVSGCATTSISQRRTDDSNTLYVGYVGTSFPTAYMPWLSRDGIAPTIASMIYGTLFSYDSQKAEYVSNIGMHWCYVDLAGNPLTEDGTFETKVDYEAVEAYYSNIPDDYAVVRVEIDEGIKWSDGEKLTVDDVYYSFDVATNYAYTNHAGALVWTADLKHKSDGDQLIQQGMFTAKNPDLSGIFSIPKEKEDTVMYLLVDKSYDALTTLFTTILILPQHIWQPVINETNQINSKSPSGKILEEYKNPTGSGPWIYNYDESNAQQIVLEKNPNYHIKNEDGTDIYEVDKIKIILCMDVNTALFALRNGYVDLLDTNISSNYVELLKSEDDIIVSQSKGTSITSLVLNVNPASPYDDGMKLLLNDLEFRKALALAINQDELIQKVLNNTGETVSSGLVLKSHNIIFEEKANILNQPIDEKIKEANQILDRLYPNKDEFGNRLYDGKPITFEILGSPQTQDLVLYLDKQFEKIGINVTFKASGSTPESTYLFSGNFDMTTQSVILSMANAGVMFKSHFVTTERSSNYGRLSNDEIAQKIEAMKATMNEEKKIEIVKELQVLVANQYYKLPLYSSEILSVARTDRFTGFQEVDGGTLFNGSTLRNLKRVD